MKNATTIEEKGHTKKRQGKAIRKMKWIEKNSIRDA